MSCLSTGYGISVTAVVSRVWAEGCEGRDEAECHMNETY